MLIKLSPQALDDAVVSFHYACAYLPKLLDLQPVPTLDYHDCLGVCLVYYQEAR